MAVKVMEREEDIMMTWVKGTEEDAELKQTKAGGSGTQVNRRQKLLS